MAKVTNNDIGEQLGYIKGKLEAEEKFAKEHRGWEVVELQKIEKHLRDQNSRIRKAEVSIGWFKGIMFTITATIGWLLKKVIGD